MAFSFIKLISSSDTLPKREAAILKICHSAIITSAEVIIAEYDVILGQWEGENFYISITRVIILNTYTRGSEIMRKFSREKYVRHYAENTLDYVEILAVNKIENEAFPMYRTAHFKVWYEIVEVPFAEMTGAVATKQASVTVRVSVVWAFLQK